MEKSSHLLESMSVENLPAATVRALLPTVLKQPLSSNRNPNPPFLRRRDDDLTYSGKGVSRGLEMPVPRSSSKEQEQSNESGPGGDPEPESPHSFILKKP